MAVAVGQAEAEQEGGATDPAGESFFKDGIRGAMQHGAGEVATGVAECFEMFPRLHGGRFMAIGEPDDVTVGEDTTGPELADKITNAVCVRAGAGFR